MKKISKQIRYKNIAIYKILLFLITTIAIVYLFPKGGKFKYEYKQGKPWQYDNLYAPFDFAIQKTEKEIFDEKAQIKEHSKLYFLINLNTKNSVLQTFETKINSIVFDEEQL